MLSRITAGLVGVIAIVAVVALFRTYVYSGYLFYSPPTALVVVAVTTTPVPTLQAPQSTYTPYPPQPTLTPYQTQALSTSTQVPPTATPTQSQTTTSTVTVTSTPTQIPANYQAAHFARLEQLDEIYRSQGLEAWLKAAGVTWDSLNADARQIEEETSPSGRILASGFQVKGTNIRINWPVIVTTDRPSEVIKTSTTITHQPDLRNPSVLYTNVVLNGQGTIWIDGTNWDQFTSQLGMSGSKPAVVSPTVTVVLRNTPVPPTTTPVTTKSQSSTTTCLTVSQLDSRYGIDEAAQGAQKGLLYDKGVLSGAVLKLTSQQADELTRLGWTIQGTNPLIKSAWSPQSCRPLK